MQFNVFNALMDIIWTNPLVHVPAVTKLFQVVHSAGKMEQIH